MKTARLLQLLIYLLANEQATGQELAERFSVSKRTIYRDIAALEEAGIPIVVTQGARGGFSLMSSYKLKTVTFTTAEKGRLLKVLNIESGLMLADEIGLSLVEKIQLLTLENPPVKEFISVDEGTIHPPDVENQTKIKVNQINQSIIDQQALKLSYVDGKGELTEREVIPEELILKDGSWYLEAYCGLRQSIRLFKLTRIQELAIIPRIREVSAVKPELEDVEKTLRTICLEFLPSELGKLYDFFSPDKISLGLTGEIIVNFAEEPQQNILPLLLMFGNKVKVISPESLIAKHQQEIQKMLKIY